MASSRKILAEIRELRLEGREDRARSDALMEEIREDRARSDALMQEIREEMRFTREVIRRNEIAFQQGGAALAELVETVREMKEEVRAQTRAIFKLIDRMDGGPAGPLPEPG